MNFNEYKNAEYWESKRKESAGYVNIKNAFFQLVFLLSGSVVLYFALIIAAIMDG